MLEMIMFNMVSTGHMWLPKFYLNLVKLKIQFLSYTSHTLGVQWSLVTNGYYFGQFR